MMSRIPATDSIEELARFWDSHDLTDFEDELEEVSEAVSVRPAAVPVVLTPEERIALRRIAASQGVAEAKLIHDWVKEKLRV